MSTPNSSRCSPLSVAWLLVGLLAGTAQAGDGGLRWNPDMPMTLDGRAAPRWQGRFGLASTDDGPGIAPESSSRVLGASLMGDYFFSARALSDGGGFRATGGLMLGGRGPLWSGALGTTQLAPGLSAERRGYSSYSLATLSAELDAADSTALPYVGVGYTGLFGKRSLTGVGWGFSADLGLAPRSPVRLGNAGEGQPSAVDLVRDLQLNPMLHLGVSYAF